MCVLVESGLAGGGVGIGRRSGKVEEIVPGHRAMLPGILGPNDRPKMYLTCSSPPLSVKWIESLIGCKSECCQSQVYILNSALKIYEFVLPACCSNFFLSKLCVLVEKEV